jgi:hypothetical protein
MECGMIIMNLEYYQVTFGGEASTLAVGAQKNG